MKYEIPGTPGSVVSFRSRYENFIGGQWTAPVKGGYFGQRDRDVGAAERLDGDYAVGVSPLLGPFAQFVLSVQPLPAIPAQARPTRALAQQPNDHSALLSDRD
jgi:hypothetical protein